MAESTIVPIELTDTEKSDLANLTMHPGYKALVKIMHKAANMDANAAIDADESLPQETVVALQRIAKAGKRFYVRVSDTVDWIVSELYGTQDADAEVQEILSN
jgi:hypothetical protein